MHRSAPLTGTRESAEKALRIALPYRAVNDFLWRSAVWCLNSALYDIAAQYAWLLITDFGKGQAPDTSKADQEKLQRALDSPDGPRIRQLLDEYEEYRISGRIPEAQAVKDRINRYGVTVAR